MLKFLAAGFRAGRELESAIEKFADDVKQRASQPPPPDPAQVEAEANAKAATDKVAIENKKVEQDGALKSRELDIREAEVAGKMLDAAEQGEEGEGQAKPNGASVVRGMAAVQQQLAAAMTAWAKAATAPKRIIRDAQGKAQGVETMQ
jgi:hypothetical protein